MNFEELFAQYPCPFTDEQVKAQVADIEAKHFAENNNVEVWKECLHQIDYTTLSADDTIERVEKMANAVNTFEEKFPGIPNVAAICVYPAMAESLVSAAASLLRRPSWRSRSQRQQWLSKPEQLRSTSCFP